MQRKEYGGYVFGIKNAQRGHGRVVDEQLNLDCSVFVFQVMSEQTWWETIKVKGGELIDKVEELIKEGNVRRIVIKQGDRTIAEFPLAVGVVGAVFAPVLAAVGAIAALVKDCRIEVERVKNDS